MRVSYRRPSDRPILEQLPPEEVDKANGSSLLEEDEELQEDEDDGIPFTKKMRDATRNIHRLSDHLVNAKVGLGGHSKFKMLLFACREFFVLSHSSLNLNCAHLFSAMSDDKIWVDGLLIFFEIFRFLEQALARLRHKNPHFKLMWTVLEDIPRTTAFIEDISYYRGPDIIQKYEPSPALADYLKHLETLEEREPLRLLAYMYHLYMGLLSGGQILKKKRELKKKLNFNVTKMLHWCGCCIHELLFPRTGDATTIVSTLEGRQQNNPHEGNAVTTFDLEDGLAIKDLKTRIQFAVNEIAQDLSKDERESLISESIVVFERNNEVVRSIQNTGFTALKNVTSSPIFIALLFLALGSLWFFISSL